MSGGAARGSKFAFFRDIIIIEIGKIHKLEEFHGNFEKKPNFIQ